MIVTLTRLTMRGTITLPPLSWYVDKNIKRAKFSLNFSKWGEFEPWQRRVFFQGGMMYDIDIDRMPPENYLLTHPEAKISQKQREQMKEWIATVDMRTKKIAYKE